MNWKHNHPMHYRGRQAEAFTMVEIVLSLAVIAIALVAIIGVMPYGLTVDQRNREESIINQEATIWMEAIRGGAKGADYLVPYVPEVRHVITDLSDGTMSEEQYLRGTEYTSGLELVGLLSAAQFDRYDLLLDGMLDQASTNVIARVRAINGNLADELADEDFAFGYQLVCEVIPFTNSFLAATTNTIPAGFTAQTNLHEISLTFNWPLTPQPGNARQTRFANTKKFRTLVNDPHGVPQWTDYNAAVQNPNDLPLQFFKPARYPADY